MEGEGKKERREEAEMGLGEENGREGGRENERQRGRKDG